MNRNKNLNWKYKSRILYMENLIRGIYVIFIKNKAFEEYIYVGRSNSRHDRFFKNGHKALMKKSVHSSSILNNANN